MRLRDRPALEAEFHLEFQAAIVGRFEETSSSEVRRPRALVSLSEKWGSNIAYDRAWVLVVNNISHRRGKRNGVAMVFGIARSLTG